MPDERKFTTTELTEIIQFRAENLGLIRLKKLAVPDKKRVRITLGDEEFIPRGFDVFGHPVISADNFKYYNALKTIAERKGEEVFVKVEYDDAQFFRRREIFDSIDGISATLNDITEFKRILNYRKRFTFYKKSASISGRVLKEFEYEPLHEFIVFGKYLLTEDGHIYLCNSALKPGAENVSEVMPRDAFAYVDIIEQVHIPGAEDFCSICGKKFNMQDVREVSLTENKDGRKVHVACLQKFADAIEEAYHTQS